MSLSPRHIVSFVCATAIIVAVMAPGLNNNALAASQTSAIAAKIRSYPIRNFRIGSKETKFGPLTFVAGMELRSSARPFGSMSGFRFLDQGNRFIGVTDSGFWYFGTIERDEAGRPTGMSDFWMQPIANASGGIDGEKQKVDAEALAIRGTEATVGFEREHRIATFDISPDNIAPGEMAGETVRLDFLVPRHELRRNKGFETVAYAPDNSPLKGARIAIAERSIDREGNIFAAILEGPRKGIFKVVRHGLFDITAGTFLPNGDLLLLERSFTMADGVKMRLRRIAGQTIAKGRTVDGDVLFESDLSYQIDNMEGLDSWVDGEGRLRISIVSDDNHSILQRNLYLEFILDE